jgi:hypothetical protein
VLNGVFSVRQNLTMGYKDELFFKYYSVVNKARLGNGVGCYDCAILSVTL